MSTKHLQDQRKLEASLQRKGFASAVEVRSFDGQTDPFVLFLNGGLAAFGGFPYLQKIIEEADSVEDLYSVCNRENNLSLTSLSRSA